jgi:hypothetical protein
MYIKDIEIQESLGFSKIKNSEWSGNKENKLGLSCAKLRLKLT